MLGYRNMCCAKIHDKRSWCTRLDVLTSPTHLCSAHCDTHPRTHPPTNAHTQTMNEALIKCVVIAMLMLRISGQSPATLGHLRSTDIFCIESLRKLSNRVFIHIVNVVIDGQEKQFFQISSVSLTHPSDASHTDRPRGSHCRSPNGIRGRDACHSESSTWRAPQSTRRARCVSCR